MLRTVLDGYKPPTGGSTIPYRMDRFRTGQRAFAYEEFILGADSVLYTHHAYAISTQFKGYIKLANLKFKGHG